MTLPTLIVQAAGGVQLAIVAANVVLPRKLGVTKYLPRLSPILRQVFLVHWAYIILVLIIFGVLSLTFAADLAGASPLGRALSACLALFWLLRVLIQVFYYDRQFMKENLLGHLGMTLACMFLAGVFCAAALGFLQ